MRNEGEREKKKRRVNYIIRFDKKKCVEQNNVFFNHDKSDERDLVIVRNLLSYSFPRH
jgi:hypothetical protein